MTNQFLNSKASRNAVAIVTACLTIACAPGYQTTETKQSVAPIEVHFGPAPFAYRVGRELSTAATDSVSVRRILGDLGARIGCHAVADVIISPASAGLPARSWGFCAYKVSNNDDRESERNN